MQISEQKILKDRNIYMENEYFDMSGNISQIIYMYYTKLNNKFLSTYVLF